MQKKWWLVTMLVALMLAGPIHSFAAHGEKRAAKKAILMVAFGTSVPEAQKVFGRIDAQAKESFPGLEIRWAYSSSIIRAKLAKQGKLLDSPEVALAKLMDEHYTHVAILSLHTIPGAEFHELLQNAHLFGQMAGGFEKVLIARPLLSSHDDMVKVAKALLKNLPSGRKAQDSVLLMGHGSEHHPADAIYLAMNQVFQELDANVFVATVEGHPALDDVLPKLSERKLKKVYLMPLMAVAGDHARNDMAGDEPDSWKSVLTKNGFTCEVVLKGTAEFPEIVSVWLDHLRAALAHF